MEEIYIDPILKKELDRIKKQVTKKDRDYVIVIDGREGSGKSLEALQVGAYLDSSEEGFSLKKVCFNTDRFLTLLRESPKFSTVILDEALASASSRSSLSIENRKIMHAVAEVRQQNLFIILVLPSFFDLDRYFSLHRANFLIHVYFDKKGGRGQYIVFPYQYKNRLYVKGKKTYNYGYPKSPYPPMRFFHKYPVDEQEYRRKKAEAFKERTITK
jgi:hypothetical protein